MFEQPLPKRIKPAKLARQQRTLEGFLPLASMPLLVQDCVSDQGKVEASLELKMAGSLATLSGQAQAELTMTCQRCLEPTLITLKVDISLAFVATEEQAENLSSEYEPCFQLEEEVVLAEVLEQELILALPIVAYHDSCQQEAVNQPREEEPAAPKRPNPFAVLEQLKNGGSESDD